MKFFRRTVVIPENRELSLTLPESVPVGTAELTISFAAAEKPPAQALARFFEELKRQPGDRSQTEIDRDLEQDRDAWE